MILSGKAVVSRSIIQNLVKRELQIQPCGVDLTLKRVRTWTSAGIIDLDNSHRETAKTEEIKFQHTESETSSVKPSGLIQLSPGSYLVEFNETVDMPLDIFGQIYVRSSLFRSGALIHAGVMDSGYRGVVGAVLQVVNPMGIRLYEHARLAQMVFQEMSEPTEGYSGIYQGRETV
jgi:dUTP pyrophosphatase